MPKPQAVSRNGAACGFFTTGERGKEQDESLRAYREVLGDEADAESREWVRRKYTVRVRVAGVAAFAFFVMIMGDVGYSLVRHQHRSSFCRP